jgi:ketosteroid isomerase-like protein
VSASNREIVANGYAAFNAGGVDGVLDLLDPDVRWFSLDLRLQAVQLEGRAAAADFMRQVLARAEDARFEPLELVSAGDRVLARVRLHARDPAGRAAGAWDMSHLWRVRNGRMTRFRLYLDHSRARRALTAKPR